MNYEDLIKKCYSYADVCKILEISYNGREIKKIKKIIEDNKIDISHFDSGLSKKIKYQRVLKKCPVCNNIFETSVGNRDEKFTCSHGCANSYFRSGSNNGNWKEHSYRTTCFEFHKKECIICKEDKIVEVHHLDENRENNKIDNLVPLCPTHHKYWHSSYKYLIVKEVYEYIDKFKKNNNIDH